MHIDPVIARRIATSTPGPVIGARLSAKRAPLVGPPFRQSAMIVTLPDIEIAGYNRYSVSFVFVKTTDVKELRTPLVAISAAAA